MPVHPSGEFVLDTLAEHRGLTLTAFCLACNRSVALVHQGLADRFGWNVRLEELRRRGRSRQCGRHTGRLLIGHDPPTASTE